MADDPDKPYARCLVCDTVLPTPADAQQHSNDTMTPVDNEPGVVARAHRMRILNPTPLELAENDVRYEVDRAIERCCGELWSDVERGEHSRDDVTKALAYYPDFAEVWDEWVREADS